MVTTTVIIYDLQGCGLSGWVFLNIDFATQLVKHHFYGSSSSFTSEGGVCPKANAQVF
jgi:hypothetical protein